MDCQTARLLIEAFHDDELGVVEAATLLAHFDGCPECARRNEAARRLKSVFRETRPVVQCPESLKKKVCRNMETSRRFPRAIPPSLTLFVLAAGLGLLVGEAVPLRMFGSSSVAFAESPVTQRVSGDVFCVRCALERRFPGTSFRSAPHRPILRTADGRLFTILPGSAGATLVSAGCTGRHVDLVARLYPDSGLARVVRVNAAAPLPPPSPALTLARN